MSVFWNGSGTPQGLALPQATPSIVDNLRIMWDLLREAQAADVRP
jgi:hypothetical protein